MKSYHKLVVWKEAHTLTLMVYKTTQQFPKEELYGLTSQIRRAVISVAANIVEGQARVFKKEFLQFLSISHGSLVEVEYYLELAKDVKYINDREYQALERQRAKTGFLLHSFTKSLRV